MGGGWEGVSGGSGVIDTLLVVANHGGAVSETGQSDPLFDRSSEAALGWTGGSSSAASPWNKPGSRAGFLRLLPYTVQWPTPTVWRVSHSECVLA